MRPVPSPIAACLVAALALAACGAPRALLFPGPPPAVRKEAAAPSPAAGERAAPQALPGEIPPAEKPPAAPGAEKPSAGGAAPAAVAIPAPPDRLPQYAEACGRTEWAVTHGAPLEVIPLWQTLEDSKWGTDAVYNQGVLQQLAGNLDEADAQYRRALDRSPAFEPALANLLGISLLKGDRPRMKSLLARAVPPGSAPPPEMLPELAVNAAAALMETGRHDDAALLLLSLRKRGTATPALPWNMAVLSYRKGDLAAARDLAGKVPSDVASLYPVVASRFAWAKEGEMPPALGPAPPGMTRMGALSYNLAAYTVFRSGNAAAAEKLLALATSGEFSLAEIMTNIGILQVEQGRWSDARSSLERAVREDPGLAAGWLNLGTFREIYEGNLSSARECYDNYVKLGGSRKEEVRKWVDWLGQSASPRE